VPRCTPSARQKRPEDNWRDGANVVDYASGWDIPRLYGGYISPLSRLKEPDGMHFFVSQWAEGNVPYKAFLVRATLWATADLEVARPTRETTRTPEVIDLNAGPTASPRDARTVATRQVGLKHRYRGEFVDQQCE
jgi:hypothetical protein